MNHWLAAAALAAAVLCALTGCGKGGKDLSIPTEYLLGEESVPALTPGEGARLAEQTSGESGEVFTYSDISTPGETAEAYAATLTGEANGFVLVDEALKEAQAPDYASAEGEARLAKDAAAAGKVLLLCVSWSEGTCVVTAAMPEGAVERAVSEGMTLPEAISFLQSLSPEVIGLSGASMDQYEVYTMDGAVLVDGHPCIQLNVYSKDNPARTNHAAAFYLLTADARHLYRLDQETRAVEEISLP